MEIIAQGQHYGNIVLLAVFLSSNRFEICNGIHDYHIIPVAVRLVKIVQLENHGKEFTESYNNVNDISDQILIWFDASGWSRFILDVLLVTKTTSLLPVLGVNVGTYTMYFTRLLAPDFCWLEIVHDRMEWSWRYA